MIFSTFQLFNLNSNSINIEIQHVPYGSMKIKSIVWNTAQKMKKLKKEKHHVSELQSTRCEKTNCVYL